MKNSLSKAVIICTAILFLSIHGVFAADQTKDRIRDRVQDQTCIKDASGDKIKNTKQNRNIRQSKQANKNKKGKSATE